MSRKGFTLLEILLVLALLVVLAGVTAYFIPPTSGQRLQQGAIRFAGACERAAATARRMGVRTRLTLDTKAGKWRMTVELDPVEEPDEFGDAPDGGSREFELPEGVSFGKGTEVGAARPGAAPEARDLVVIDFAPDGTCDAAVVELTIDDGGIALTRYVALEPLAAAVSIESEAPDLAALPGDLRRDSGEVNPAALDIESLLQYGGGLGGNNPDPKYDPAKKMTGLLDEVEQQSSRKEPAHGLYPTLNGR